MRIRSRSVAINAGLAITCAAALVSCSTAAPTPSAPPVVVVPPPAQQQPATQSPQTQYVPYPAPPTQYVPYPAYPYYPPPNGYSGADADFLARLKARDIVTPDETTQIAGGRQVCANISAGSNIHTEANKLMNEPYDYSAPLAGYFTGEAVKVYCPQYSYQLN